MAAHRVLLVLDNCERVLAQAAELVEAWAGQCLGAASAVREGRAQDTGFVLLDHELAVVRQTAGAALGESAVGNAMAAARSGESSRVIAEVRAWLASIGTGDVGRDSGVDQDSGDRGHIAS